MSLERSPEWLPVSICGVDMGWKNHAQGFYDELQKCIDLIKIDFSQEKNEETGFYEQIVYEEKYIIKIMNDFVNKTWDEFWSRIEFTAIEEQMYGTMVKGRLVGDKRYKLMSRILYTILEARGIPCVMVNQEDIKKDLGISLLPSERTKSASKNRKLNKKKAIAKMRQIIGPRAFASIKQKFGKVDDVADAFLITLWAKFNIKKLLQKKKKNAKFTWEKKKYVLGKKFIKERILLDI